MIAKIQPDKQKSKSLYSMAKITLERLHQTNMHQYPSNTLVDYYDVIHKLLDSLTLAQGIKIKGEGAHQELIDYAAKQNKIDEQTRLFLQQMRDYRNRISYEGFLIHENYIHLNKKKIEKLITRLFEMVKDILSEAN